jgi:hypothetical protein
MEPFRPEAFRKRSERFGLGGWNERCWFGLDGCQPGSDQSYVFAETMGTWEASPWLAFNVSPKLALNETTSPWGVGLSANMQLGTSFQLIPELNLVASDFTSTNATLALRWLAFRQGERKSATIDLYLSNASGLLDLGQLLRSSDLRVGGRLGVTF